MKITNLPKDLDVILRFEDMILVCSDNPSYNTPTYYMDCYHRSTDFTISRLITEEKMQIQSCKIQFDAEAVDITIENTITISSSVDGLKFNVDGVDKKIDEIKPFIKRNIISQSHFMAHIEVVSFNSHRTRLGYKEIYHDLKSIYHYPDRHSLYNEVSYYYYFSTPEMYAIAERFIKLGLKKEITKYNPAISNKPIPDISELKVLSKISNKIISEIGGRSELNITQLFEELEENPHVGVNGIKMIDEMLNLYQHISCNIDFYELDCFHNYYNYKNIYMGFNTLTKQFNISTKNLINRMIKATFYESLSPNKYISMVTDYIRMSELLELEVPDKLPKDIVREHDLIAAQYQYLQNKETEDKFKEKTDLNKLLLSSVPEHSKYTIISPNVPNDLIEEGIKMRHCVGTYINRYVSGVSKIFFVRNKSDLENSYVTVELNKSNRLVQARSFANSEPNKETMEFICKWIETL